MTELDLLKVLALTTPVLIVLMALLVVWLTRWQDAREDRRRAERSTPAQ
jgi:hypothetical protein